MSKSNVAKVMVRTHGQTGRWIMWATFKLDIDAFEFQRKIIEENKARSPEHAWATRVVPKLR